MLAAAGERLPVHTTTIHFYLKKPPRKTLVSVSSLKTLVRFEPLATRRLQHRGKKARSITNVLYINKMALDTINVSGRRRRRRGFSHSVEDGFGVGTEAGRGGASYILKGILESDFNSLL